MGLRLRSYLILLLLISTPSPGATWLGFHGRAKGEAVCLTNGFAAAIELPLHSVAITDPRFDNFTPGLATKIALARSELPPADRVLAIPEGQVKGAVYKPTSTRFLSTSFLDSCVGVAIYDPVARAGSLGHFVNIGELSGPMTRYAQFAQKLQSDLLSHGGNSTRVRITLVWGNTYRRAGELQLELLIDALRVYFPGVNMQIDSQIGNSPRSMVLDLWDGRTLETTHSSEAVH